MAGATDITSAVGTWIGASLALIALVGVIGPFLIYRASKAERNIALDAVGNDTGYVSAGVKVTRSIRLFRQVRAPQLRYEPTFDGNSCLALNLNSLSQRARSSTSWVNFGMLVEAYNLRFERDDAIAIARNRTWLPVHRYWILTLGLAGRYSDRTENSVLITPIGPAALNPANDVSIFGAIGQRHLDRARYVSYSESTIRGITGSIGRSDSIRPDAYTFKLHDLYTLAQDVPQDLPIRSLLWLALGALPQPGDRVCMLDDNEQHLEKSSRWGDDISVSANSDEISRGSIEQIIEEEPVRDSHAPGSLRAYHLKQVEDPAKLNLKILSNYGVWKETVFRIEEIPISTADFPELRSYYSATYIPASSEWTRLSARKQYSAADKDTWMIRRLDVQSLALGLLEFQWSPEGYLFRQNKASSKVFRFLCEPAKDVYRLLSRTYDSLDGFGLSGDEKNKWKDILDPAIKASEKKRRDRLATTTFFRVEEKCREFLQQSNELAGQVIGVLTITSAEFRSLVTQFARYRSEATQANNNNKNNNINISIDFNRGMVRVPSVLGMFQEFPINSAEFSPQAASLLGKNVELTAKDIILATLRACTISLLLLSTYSSRPLLNFVSNLSTEVYID